MSDRHFETDESTPVTIFGRTYHLRGDGDPADRIGAALSARGRSLLLLDNFEQVAGTRATSGASNPPPPVRTASVRGSPPWGAPSA